MNKYAYPPIYLSSRMHSPDHPKCPAIPLAPNSWGFTDSPRRRERKGVRVPPQTSSLMIDRHPDNQCGVGAEEVSRHSQAQVEYNYCLRLTPRPTAVGMGMHDTGLFVGMALMPPNYHHGCVVESSQGPIPTLTTSSPPLTER